MDSSVSPTHGEQEMSVWNGHYACTCYHPLFVFNQFGDLERSALRPGNVHSADGWDGVLKPVVTRYQGKVSRIYFRADAAFAMPEVYEFLEAERIKYAIRLPANQVLQSRIGYLLKRPIGRPPNEIRRFHANFSYRAGRRPEKHQYSRRFGSQSWGIPGKIMKHLEVVFLAVIVVIYPFLFAIIYEMRHIRRRTFRVRHDRHIPGDASLLQHRLLALQPATFAVAAFPPTRQFLQQRFDLP